MGEDDAGYQLGWHYRYDTEMKVLVEMRDAQGIEERLEYMPTKGSFAGWTVKASPLLNS